MRSEHDLRPTRTGIPSVGPQAVPVALALGERHIGSVRRWLEGTLGRDLLVLHEAARVGARVAATTSGTTAPERAARAAAPELRGLVVEVAPTVRSDGDLVVVVVSAEHRLGPVTRTLEARAIARVEPVVGG